MYVQDEANTTFFCSKRGASSGEFFFFKSPSLALRMRDIPAILQGFKVSLLTSLLLFFHEGQRRLGPFVFRLTRGSSYVGKQGTAGEISISSPLTSLQLCLSLFLSLMLGWPQNAISFSCHEGNVTTSVSLSARREKKQIKSDLHAAKQMYQQVSFLSFENKVFLLHTFF